MKIFRCGCGLLSAMSLLPVLLLALGVLAILNAPSLLPGSLADLATGARTTAASVAINGELGDTGIQFVEASFDPGDRVLTVVLVSTKAAAPSPKTLLPVVQTLGRYLAGPLAMSDGAASKIVITILGPDGPTPLVRMRVKTSDLQAYVEGKITAETFRQRIKTLP